MTNLANSSSSTAIALTRKPASRFDQAALAAFRFIPGVGKVEASARVLMALRGSTWTIIGYGASQFLRMATQLVLARMLLGPDAFGLVALVSVFLSGMEMLTDLGIATDVVQHPRGDEPEFINTAFWIQGARGLVLWVVAAGLAYPFARFYHQPAVLWMIFVAALSVPLRGFASSSLWTKTRHVQLGALTTLTTGADAVAFVVSVIWALVSPSAWALVIGRVAGTAAYTIGSHIIAETSVKLEWDSRSAKDILLFGAGIFVSSATYFLSGEAERLVIGKLVTTAELGCFSLALAISLAPARGIQQLIGQVLFPILSNAVHQGPSAAIGVFRKARALVLVAGIALGCTSILAGKLIVRVLLGPTYADAGWMLQLLGVRGALELFSCAAGSMLFATGISQYSAIGNVAKLIFLSLSLPIAFSKFGFREVVWMLTLSQIANYLPHLWGLTRYSRTMAQVELVCFTVFIVCTLVAVLFATTLL